MELQHSSVATHEKTNVRLQCTHLLDLAGLILAVAARGASSCEYDMVVSDPNNSAQSARLKRDGIEKIHWQLTEGRIQDAGEISGISIGSGFTAWARDTMKPIDAEAALLLRRTVFISRGRQVELDSPDYTPTRSGACYALQPGRIERATRRVGSSRDFSDKAGQLLAGVQAWLAFDETAE